MMNLVPIAHIVAAVFSIIELGLTAYVASAFSTWYGSWVPSIVGFMIFNSIWSLLVLAYVGITPLYMTSIFHKLVALVLNVVTTIFWFAGSIAMAVQFGGPGDCGRNTYCGSARAAIAFGFFLWVIFTFLTVIDALESLRSRGHSTGVHAKGPAAYPGA